MVWARLFLVKFGEMERNEWVSMKREGISILIVSFSFLFLQGLSQMVMRREKSRKVFNG
jgi:TRAP-type mannitol/chloroaromatic compound transport system permease small subunit